MIRIYTAAHLQEAQLLVQLLEVKRIATMMTNANASGALGELPVTLPEIWLLDERDVALAQTIIEEYEDSTRRSNEQRQCPDCSEQSPGSFDLCWQCGAEL